MTLNNIKSISGFLNPPLREDMEAFSALKEHSAIDHFQGEFKDCLSAFIHLVMNNPNSYHAFVAEDYAHLKNICFCDLLCALHERNIDFTVNKTEPLIRIKDRSPILLFAYGNVGIHEKMGGVVLGSVLINFPTISATRAIKTILPKLRSSYQSGDKNTLLEVI